VWQVSVRQASSTTTGVGTLTIPGGLTMFQPPVPMAVHDDRHRGATAPPDVAAMAHDPTLPIGPDSAFAEVAPRLPAESLMASAAVTK
jgi:hypothetical protein